MSCNLIVKIAHLPATGKIALKDTYLRHTLNQEKENLNLKKLEEKEKNIMNHMTSLTQMMKWKLMYNLI